MRRLLPTESRQTEDRLGFPREARMTALPFRHGCFPDAPPTGVTVINSLSNKRFDCYPLQMPTLITVRWGGGRRSIRCDATCYNAKTVNSHKCLCICGGANHGVGLPQAYKNTLDLNGRWVKNWRKSHDGPIEFEVKDQLELPLSSRRQLPLG